MIIISTENGNTFYVHYAFTISHVLFGIITKRVFWNVCAMMCHKHNVRAMMCHKHNVHAMMCHKHNRRDSNNLHPKVNLSKYKKGP
jgi:hypothetical protein